MASTVLKLLILLFLSVSYCAGIYNGKLVAKETKDGSKTVYKNQRKSSYFVSVEKKIGKDSGEHQCGGVLIRKDAVLTTAVCVKDRKIDDTYVRAGHVIRGDIATEIEKTGVKRFIIHENFDFKTSMKYDIALIQVHTPFNVKKGSVINVVKLPTKEVTAGDKLAIFGMGQTKGANSNEFLRTIDLTVLKGGCDISVNKHGYKNDIICAQPNDGQAFCKEDHGGPAVLHDSDNAKANDPDFDTLYGLMSNTEWKQTTSTILNLYVAECETGSGSILTSVYFYLDWIKGKLNTF